MHKILSSMILTAGFAYGAAFPAGAKLPDAVLEPYRAYNAALKSGDEDAVYKHAKKAWEAAEKSLGDHKTTGDLAHNFAEVAESGRNPFKSYKTRIKARKRALSLAVLHPEDMIGPVETERALKLVETSFLFKSRKDTNAYFKKAEGIIAKHNYGGGTFEGDLEVLRSRYFNMRGEYEKSVQHADKAKAIYDARSEDDFASTYTYFVPFYKGSSLKELGKPIEAALQYQGVMQNLEGQLPADHALVESAFKKWMLTRSELDDAGLLAEAEQAGLCECWPFEDYKSKVVPLERVPPKTPAAFLQGRHSGHVFVKLDVDDSGRVENAQVVSSTARVLENAALKSTEKWKFSPRQNGEPEGAREGVTTKITFHLLSPNGNILPEPRTR